VQLINQNKELVNNLLMNNAHFHLSGFVNKQYFHYWSATNPTELHDRPLHSSEVTVWWAISSFGITGPYFFEDEREKAVTVTGPRYIHVLESCFSPDLARHPVTEETFFQQDGATSHTTQDSMAAVRNLFPNHVISRYGDNTLPASSPNLSACDFFLWGYMKSQVFKAPAPHIVQLKQRIQQEVKRIPMEMLQRVMGDVRKTLTQCLEQNGGHLNDVIFRK
jgi:hypothetical protein